MATRKQTYFVMSGNKGTSQAQVDKLHDYIDSTLAGAGAVAGKPCQIQSITPITGGTRIIFEWSDNSGTSHTSSMDVMNGTDGHEGSDAPVVTGVTLLADNSLRFNFSDGSYFDTTPVPAAKGDKGEPGENGFAPQITVEEDSTSNYILRIKTADDEFTTPNLKGAGAAGGGGDVTGVKGSVEAAYRKGDVNLTLLDIVNIGEKLTYNAATKTLSANVQVIDVDSTLDDASENPVQNKVVKAAVDDINETLTSFEEITDAEVDAMWS